MSVVKDLIAEFRKGFQEGWNEGYNNAKKEEPNKDMKNISKELRNINKELKNMNKPQIENKKQNNIKSPENEFEEWEIAKAYDERIDTLSKLLEESYCIWTDLYNENQKIKKELDSNIQMKEKYDFQILELDKQGKIKEIEIMVKKIQQIAPAIERLTQEYQHNSEMLSARQNENNELQTMLNDLKAEKRNAISSFRSAVQTKKSYTELRKFNDEINSNKDMQELKDIREYVSTLNAESISAKNLYEENIDVQVRNISNALNYDASIYVAQLKNKNI